MRRSAAARLLGLRVRIPLEASICLLWVLCVVSYRSLRRADRFPRGFSPSVVCLEHYLEVSIMRRPCLTRGLLRNGKKKVYMVHHNKWGLYMDIIETLNVSTEINIITPKWIPNAVLREGYLTSIVEVSWNVMAHLQKPVFVFRRNGRVHLNRWGRQFSRLLAAEVCASAVVILDTPCSEVVWRVVATYSIRQVSLHFPSRAAPCPITFQLQSTTSSPPKIARILLVAMQIRSYQDVHSDL